MDQQHIVQQTADFVKRKFSDEGSGHDWWHMYRVWQLAKHIAQTETADLFVVELGALLHDIADWKFHDGDDEAGPRAAKEWLESLNVENATITQVEDIVRHISFKGAGAANKMESIEGKIVQDADRLDALGAIGIARAFAYGGSKHRVMYDAAVKPTLHQTEEAYKTNGGTTINHFYEKLLLLKDRMNTKTGKEIAEARHAYMESFLAEFYDEWDGKH